MRWVTVAVVRTNADERCVGDDTDLAVQQTAGGVDRDQESVALAGEEGDDAGFSGDG